MANTTNANAPAVQAQAASTPISISDLFAVELETEYEKARSRCEAWKEARQKISTVGLASYRYEQLIIDRQLAEIRQRERDRDSAARLVIPEPGTWR